MLTGSKHLWLLALSLSVVGSVSAESTDSSRISLSCVSWETAQGKKDPLVSLHAYTFIGAWSEGKWKRTNVGSITPSTSRVAGFGGGTLSLGDRTYDVATTLSVRNAPSTAEAKFDATSKTISIVVRSLAYLTSQGAELTLRADGLPPTRLTCFSQRTSALAKRASGKALDADQRVDTTASTSSSASSESEKKPQYCNSNRPTGLAQCPDGQLNVGPKGANGNPVVDRSVTRCSIFSDVSVADANAKAVAEANARAAGALNCWHVVTECRYTPSDKCPPGMVALISPPTCVIELKKEGYFSQTSYEDALKRCQTEAARNPLCANYDPRCTAIKAPQNSSDSSSSSSSSAGRKSL